MKKKENAKNLKMDIKDLLVLVHILDEYETFKKQLEKFLQSKNNIKNFYDLADIFNHKCKIGKSKAVKFYCDNKFVIDTIDKYSNIFTFIKDNYDTEGNLREESCLDEFYRYFISHKDDLDKIISLLEKIKELGIRKLKLDEQTDFTGKIYTMDRSIELVFHIYYLENIEVIPNYQNDKVKYRTTDSNYMLDLPITGSEISDYRKSITVNNLLFDKSKLPTELTKQSTFDVILNQKGALKKECEQVRSCIDLSISVDNLKKEASATSKVIERIGNVASKQELQIVLESIKLELDKLQLLSKKYDEKTNDDLSFTSEQLAREKKLELERIYWSHVDFD